MTLLAPGANTGVNTQTLNVTVSYSPVPCAELDVSAFLLTASGKVRGDNDMCFFGHPISNSSSRYSCSIS